MKHQPYRRNDGFWSCRVCRWTFHTRPSKDNCPGVLRIERANDEYKTKKQWRKLGFEVVVPDGEVLPLVDAVSIVHSNKVNRYYHRDHVRHLYFQILEKTPFSIEYYPSEPFRPIAEYQLQEAEHALRINKTYYYERAVKIGDRFGYPLEIAERIIEYWRKRWTFAEYQLKEINNDIPL